MLRFISYFAIALVLAAGAVLALAMTKPDHFDIQRSAAIKAPPERIYPMIANLKTMNTWNPFVKPDPNIKVTYSGPDSGKGAAHTWSGNSEVGEGRIEIVDATAPKHVTMLLDMVKPMAARNKVDFSLEPQGEATNVTWEMSGDQPLIGKIVSVFIDCDKMVGQQFEKGLASLKAAAETK